MFKHLSIRNYALIENLEIDFHEGLNILTGETGSGKSIILGALGLILGDRADKMAVFQSKSKCIVEGVFSFPREKFEDFFRQNDLDFEPDSHLRREVLASGKSRAFINDTPVTLSVLKEIGLRLVDIHSQHQTLRIHKTNYQLQLFDRFAGTEAKLKDYQDTFKEYKETQHKLEDLQSRKRQQVKEMDFVKFQLQELEEAQLDGLDSQDLEEEYNTLANAEDISKVLYAVNAVLSEEEGAALSSLKDAASKLNELYSMGSAYAELCDRIQSSIIELEDLNNEVFERKDKIEFDPKRLEDLEEVKTLVFKLEQKHGVEGIDRLMEVKKKLEQDLSSSEHLDLDIESHEVRLKSLKKGLLGKGEQLSNLRLKKASAFSEKTESLLRSLNMKKAIFKLEFSKLEEPEAYGLDALISLFSANRGVEPQPIDKVASGGELSRLMLALKSLSAKPNESQTIIFDEIDTGVSGEVAHSMGTIMKDISSSSQLIAITHLPQIAAKGDNHYKVFKKEEGEGTTTEILQLSDSERIVEIAHMLSGKTMTDAALANARDLLHLN